MILTAPYLPTVTFTQPIENLAVTADGLVKSPIDITPWPLYNYKPNVAFVIAHGDNCILLKYYVQEKDIRALYCRPNEPVYKDTCVEFFISFADEKNYYNFEFNCIGTGRVGYGSDRNHRNLLCEKVVKNIKKHSVITSNASCADDISWELTLLIPFEAFYFHTFTSLKNVACKVNFYKCGDDLPEPHFVSWKYIKAEKPDFHLSEYFGDLTFI